MSESLLCFFCNPRSRVVRLVCLCFVLLLFILLSDTWRLTLYGLCDGVVTVGKVVEVISPHLRVLILKVVENAVADRGIDPLDGPLRITLVGLTAPLFHFEGIAQLGDKLVPEFCAVVAG